jgi:hypothetical protein
MAYTKYSLTPANNTAAPPDGAPEGMLPSAVNDTMRDMMAQIRDVGDGVRDGTYTMTAPKITGGTITGVTLTGNTLTNPVITGATLTTSAFNGTVGATTASTGAFTTINASTSITNAGLTSGRVTFAGASGLLTDSANLLYSGTDLTVYGLTVGRGGGAVASNTALGVNALGVNTTGLASVALGQNALKTNVSGNYNIAIGDFALEKTVSGSNNIGIGSGALDNNTASNNTAVGFQAGFGNSSGASNVYVGSSSGYSTSTNNSNTFVGQSSGYGTTGGDNTFLGQNSGSGVTSGTKNTIIGRYSGSAAPISATGSNFVVLSDGDGNPLISTNSTSSVALNGAVPQTGTGITFPATQNASSNANTLDDYEEGTFTVTFTPSTSGTITLSGSYNTATYTKVGRLVTVTGEILVASASAPVGTSVIIGGLPFVSGSGASFSTGFAVLDLATQTLKSARLSTTNSTVDLFVNASTIGTNSNFILGFSYIV